MPEHSSPFIVALDAGTTSVRAIVFDRFGREVRKGQREFGQHYPQPGWVEHDAEEIWNTQRLVVEELIASLGIRKEDIGCVGITNQRETIVVWDAKTGKPLAPAIVWQDRRTSARCLDLKRKGFEETVRKRTGLLLDPYFSSSKLEWLLSTDASLRAKAESGEALCGTVDTWLIWKLTGGRCHATDVTNASRTMLFDIGELRWSDEMLTRFGIPSALLPEVRGSSDFFGEVTELDVLKGVPITGVAGDQHAALFGQACFQPGMAKNTYGTGCFLLMQTGEKKVVSRNGLLTTIAWQIGPEVEYALEGSIFVGGAVVQWLRDELGLVASAAECSELAASVDDANGAYIVPAFAGLGAPYWDSRARGIIAGLTRGVSKAHVCRAAIECIAYQTADLIAAMEADSGIRLHQLKADGGASVSEALMRFQADLLGVPVSRPVSVESTARGVAFLAGLHCGIWKDKEELVGVWEEGKRFEPSSGTPCFEGRMAGWRRAVERARNWVD